MARNQLSSEEQSKRVKFGNLLLKVENLLPRTIVKGSLPAAAQLTSAMVQHWRDGTGWPSFNNLTAYTKALVKAYPASHLEARNLIALAYPDFLLNWDKSVPIASVDATSHGLPQHTSSDPGTPLALPAISSSHLLTSNRIRALTTARFDLIESNTNPDEGRNLLLAVYFGSYVDGAPALWDYRFHLDRCLIHLSTNAAIVGAEIKEAKSDDGDNKLRLKVDGPNLENDRSYVVENPVPNAYLKGNYSEVEICLLKGSPQKGDRVWLSVSSHGLMVTMNTGGRELQGKERQRVVQQWVKLKEEEFDPSGSLDLSETRFD